MHADVRLAVLPVGCRHMLRRNAVEWTAKLGFDLRQELVEAPGVQHVFQTRLLAVGAVAAVDIDAHDRIGHGHGIGGPHQHAGRSGEILVAGDAAQPQPEPHARGHRRTICDAHRREGDVVGVLEHGNDAAAVEADVELARQAVQRAVIEDVVMPGARVGAGVQQLLGVDAGRGRAGDVADVVGTGSLGIDAELAQGLQQRRAAFGGDVADLQVGARRHVRIAPAPARRCISDAVELPVREDAVRQAQPAHEGAVGGGEEEEPVEAPAEVVEALGELAGGRLRSQTRIGIEGMLVALGLLLGGDFLAVRLEARHGGEVCRFRSRGCRGTAEPAQRLEAGRGARGLQARHEAFQIALLLLAEVLRAHHAASANACPNASAPRKLATEALERMRSAYQSASCVSPTSTTPASRPSRITSLW